MTIAKLELSPGEGGHCLVFLDDGSFLRIDKGDVIRLGLYNGMEVSGARHGELREAAARSAAREKALELLSRRPMSRKELIEKLAAPSRGGKKPPASKALAGETADWLEDLGYLNDAEYAKTVVRHYSSKGCGERKLREELYRRGVPREDWEDALAGARPPEEGIDAFLQNRFRGGAPDRKELKRAGDALARRGYRWEEIREGLSRYEPEPD